MHTYAKAAAYFAVVAFAIAVVFAPLSALAASISDTTKAHVLLERLVGQNSVTSGILRTLCSAQ